MPFTFSHPAIVLPFLKKHQFVSATGLVVGSMCPDFEYFIRMKVASSISHSFLGLFLFNLPVGLLVAFLFHNCIKEALIDNLPVFLRNRLQALRNSHWNVYALKHFLIVVISILLGAASHIFWDSFTHETGYFVGKILFLQQKAGSVGYYKILQHLSSLIGMVVLLCFLFRMPIEEKTATPDYVKYWLSVLFFTTLFFAIRQAFGLSLLQIGDVIVSLIASVILATIMIGLLFKK